ncbi:hypothetical protein ACTQ5H_09495 [Limosilactobacillus reuteri]
MKKNKTENKTTQPKKHSKKKFTILALLAGAIALPIYLVLKCQFKLEKR